MLTTQAIVMKRPAIRAGHALNMLANQTISPIPLLPFGIVRLRAFFQHLKESYNSPLTESNT